MKKTEMRGDSSPDLDMTVETRHNEGSSESPLRGDFLVVTVPRRLIQGLWITPQNG